MVCARLTYLLREVHRYWLNLQRWSRWCQQAFFLLVRCCCSLTGCGKSLNRDDSPPQGLKPSLILHDLRGAKAPLYRSAAGFRDFFRSLLERELSALSYSHSALDVWSWSSLRMSSKHSICFLGCSGDRIIASVT